MEKKFWIDFVEGRVSVDEMLNKIKVNKKLIDWFDGIVSSDKKMSIVKEVVGNGYKDFKIETVKFNLEGYLQEGLNLKDTTLAKHLNIFSTIAEILVKAFPNDNIQIDQTLNKKFNFMLGACPDYIGGIEADELVCKLYNEKQNISKKQFKEEIKKLFHLEKCKYPRWMQSPEWPISQNGKPMKFIKQSTDKETQITKYTFEDVDTKKEIIVEQFT